MKSFAPIAAIMIGVCVYSGCRPTSAQRRLALYEPNSIEKLTRELKEFTPSTAYAVCQADEYYQTWLVIEEEGQSRFYRIRALGVSSSGEDRRLSWAEMATLRDCFQKLPDDSGRKMPMERIAFVSYPGEKGRVFKMCDLWCVPRALVTIFELADRFIGPWYPGGDEKPVHVFTNEKKRFFTDMAVSPDESTLVTVDEDGLIRQWDVSTGKSRLGIRGSDIGSSHQHSDLPDFIAVSPNGSHLATKTRGGLAVIDQRDGSSRFVGVKSGPDLHNLRASFSPDGKWLAVKLSHEVNLYDVANLQWKKTFSSEKHAHQIQFHPNGRVLAVSAEDRLVFLEIATGQELSAVKTGRFKPFACSPDGKMVAVIAWEGRKSFPQGTVADYAEYQVYDITAIKRPRLKLAGEVGIGQDMKDIVWAPDSSTFATGSSGPTWLVDSETGELLAAIQTDARTVRQCMLSDCATLVSLQLTGEIQIFNIKKYLRKYRTEQKPVRADQ